MKKKLLFARNPFAKSNRSCFTVARWRAFLRSRFWLGAPVVLVVAFVVLFLMSNLAEHLPVMQAIRRSFVFAAIVLFSWAMGIWASLGESEPKESEKQNAAVGMPRWMRLAIVFGAAVLAFALMCATQLEEIADGRVARGVTGIVLKALVVMAVVIPVYITEKNR